MGRGTLAVNLIVYALVLAYAVWREWRSNDFVWAFWLAGAITILISFVCLASLDRLAERKPGDSAAKTAKRAIGTALVMDSFVSLLMLPIVFGSLAIVLNNVMPLPGLRFSSDASIFFVMWALAGEISRRFWPFVAGICAARLWTILSASGRSGSPQLKSAVENVCVREFLRTISIIFLAVVGQLLIAGWSQSMATYANYFLLAFFLFPWTMVFAIKTPSPST